MDAQSSHANAVAITDGFDALARDPTASPIRGINAKFKDGAYYAFSEQIDVHERGFAVLDRMDGWQKLAEGCPPEYLMQKAGDPRPPQPYVDEKDWPLNFNGVPEHPWKWTHYLHLMDAATGEVTTFWTNTLGGRIAIDELSDQVAIMRRVRPDAIPVVALQSRPMPTRYGGTKPRPYFKILGWKARGSVGPQNLLAATGQDTEQKLLPATEELLNDELPS
jgi:hypothetical protein